MGGQRWIVLDVTPDTVVMICNACEPGLAQFRTVAATVEPEYALAVMLDHHREMHPSKQANNRAQRARVASHALERIARAANARPFVESGTGRTRTADVHPGRRGEPGTVRIPDRDPRGLPPNGLTAGARDQDRSPAMPPGSPERPPNHVPAVSRPLPDRLDP